MIYKTVKLILFLFIFSCILRAEDVNISDVKESFKEKMNHSQFVFLVCITNEEKNKESLKISCIATVICPIKGDISTGRRVNFYSQVKNENNLKDFDLEKFKSRVGDLKIIFCDSIEASFELETGMSIDYDFLKTILTIQPIVE